MVVFTKRDDPAAELTKRELIAALQLQGLLACPDVGGSPRDLARDAVAYADGLIDELNGVEPSASDATAGPSED